MQSTSKSLYVIFLGYSFVSWFFFFVAYEGKAAAITSVPVSWDVDIAYCPVFLEVVFQFFLADVKESKLRVKETASFSYG